MTDALGAGAEKMTTAQAALSIIQDDNAGSGPFEGPEKLLELWFAPSAEDVPDGQGERTEVHGILEGEQATERLTGLRKVKKEAWTGMLDLVRCKVLSVIEGTDVDAYLLSESSMFVWPHKLILKTCGTTTLLLGLRALLTIARERCSFSGVWRCFYSRKTFMFPERQLGPHKAWSEEVQFLDEVFEKGSAYTVGKMNGDHWLLYMTAPRADVLAHTSKPGTPSSSVVLPPKPAALKANGTSLKQILPPIVHRPSTPTLIRKGREEGLPSPYGSEPDSTLEILMSGLSPRACADFYCRPANEAPTRYPDEPDLSEGHGPGKALATKLGLDDAALFGELEVVCDAFLFSPCGFSANMVSAGSRKGESRYATVHVTPEEGWSYASFECNIDFSGAAAVTKPPSKEVDIKALVGKIVKVFEPRRFSLTLFVSREEGREDGGLGVGDDGQHDASEEGETDYEEAIHEGFKTVLSRDLVKGYRRTDRIVYEFDGYDLVFATFEHRIRQ